MRGNTVYSPILVIVRILLAIAICSTVLFSSCCFTETLLVKLNNFGGRFSVRDLI